MSTYCSVPFRIVLQIETCAPCVKKLCEIFQVLEMTDIDQPSCSYADSESCDDSCFEVEGIVT